MTTKTHTRPFPAMSPEARKAANSKGGQASTSRPFADRPDLARAASLKGVEARQLKALARKNALDDPAN